MPGYIYADGGLTVIGGDITVSEGMNASAEVTEHPVERGVNVSDHVKANPKTVSLTLFVSRTPIFPDLLKGRGSVELVELDVPQFEPPLEPTPGSLFRALAGVFKPPPPPIVAQVLTFQEVFDPVRETQDALEEILDAGKEVTIQTTTKFYDHMVLTMVSTPITEAGGAEFQIEAKQVRIVETQTVAAPTPKEPRGQPKANKGAQTTKPMAAKDAKKSASIAIQLAEKAGLI